MSERVLLETSRIKCEGNQRNMMNWDDLKYFLAVCRNGSVRAAAAELQVNHATVSRRINGFEGALDQRVFDRTAKGYQLTRLGEEIYQEASLLEERLSTVERKAANKRQHISGELRITAADVVLEYILMPMLSAFSEQHPDIEFMVMDSARNFNLSSREADVALRICHQPPDHLVGKRISGIHRACYIRKVDFEHAQDPGWRARQTWVGWSDKMRRPIGQLAADYPDHDSRHGIVSASLQAAACRLGMGMAALPCFIGDQDPELARMPPCTSEHKFDMWLLSHPDLRESVKVQTFKTFIAEQLALKRPLLEGEYIVDTQM